MPLVVAEAYKPSLYVRRQHSYLEVAVIANHCVAKAVALTNSHSLKLLVLFIARFLWQRPKIQTFENENMIISVEYLIALYGKLAALVVLASIQTLNLKKIELDKRKLFQK